MADSTLEGNPMSRAHSPTHRILQAYQWESPCRSRGGSI